MLYKHVCLSVHTCLHMTSEHVKGVEGSTWDSAHGYSLDGGTDAPVSRLGSLAMPKRENQDMWDNHLLLFSCCSVVPNSLQHHGLQHASLPCPSLSLGACSISYPLSQWCHSTISSSVVPFSFCLQPFSASGSFLMSQLFTSGGQSIGASASASVLLMNIQNLFPLRLTGLISLQSKGLLRVFSNTTV